MFSEFLYFLNLGVMIFFIIIMVRLVPAVGSARLAEFWLATTNAS